MKQKSFNKSLVDQHSQVIFLDEAHAGMLDLDNWKILTQGGLTAHNRKYKKTTPAVIRCPMFITCQKELDFDEDHNEAMDVRLHKFHFRSLTTPPVARVQQHLKGNAMDCLVWASRVARMPDDKVPLAIPGPSAEQQVIREEEKGRIRNFRLEESESDREVSEEVEQSMAAGDSSEEDGEDQGDSDADCSYSGGWVKLG